MSKPTCSVPECERPHRTRGYCATHYKKLWREERPFVPCTIEGCDKQQQARGYCPGHWARWKRTGDPGQGPIAPRPAGLCSVPECGRPRRGRGYCGAHYQRWQKKGEPGAAEILSKGDSRARDDQGRKRCSKCRQWAVIADFAPDDRTADRLHSHCFKCRRNDRLKRVYGITSAQYDAMRDEQQDRCAVCGGDNEGKEFCVDHDHSTGVVRGLLCTPCNRGIGYFRDTPAFLRVAADYLEKRRG